MSPTGPSVAHYNNVLDHVELYHQGQKTVIDDQNDARRGVGFAVDSTGTFHALYVVGSILRSVRYSFGQPGSWTRESLGSGGPATIDLVVDSNDQPRTAFATTNGVVYRERDPTTGWSYDIVEPPSGATEVSLTLDSADEPHIVYYDSTAKDLIYRRRTTTGWDRVTVDSSGDVGSKSDIVVDSQNHVHIAYHDKSNSALKYAHFDGQTWYTHTVVANGLPNSLPSITVDGNDTPHILFADGNKIRHAFFL